MNPQSPLCMPDVPDGSRENSFDIAPADAAIVVARHKGGAILAGHQRQCGTGFMVRVQLNRFIVLHVSLQNLHRLRAKKPLQSGPVGSNSSK